MSGLKVIYKGSAGWKDPPFEVLEVIGEMLKDGYELIGYYITHDPTPKYVYRISKMKPYYRWREISYYVKEDGKVKLWGSRTSPMPQTCERCNNGNPITNVYDAKADQWITCCEKCFIKDERTALVEWGWSDLFGEPGVQGEPVKKESYYDILSKSRAIRQTNSRFQKPLLPNQRHQTVQVNGFHH
jgi:hypothetical protein